MSRDVGDRIAIRHQVVDPDGTLVAATVTVEVTQPDGTLVSPAPSVTALSAGIYDASFVADTAGVWRWTWTVAGAVEEVAHGSVDVGNPAAGTYASLPQLRSMPKISTNDRDELLQVALSAAAGGIDSYTGRRRGGFYLDQTATAREYDACGRTVRMRSGRAKLLTDEIGAAGWTADVGDGTTWAAVSGLRPDPLNALGDGKPITALTGLSHWGGSDLIRVTAKWGWPAVPDEVVQATLILALRLYGRKDSPTGIAGDGQMGVVRLARNDPDVVALLSDYQLIGIG